MWKIDLSDVYDDAVNIAKERYEQKKNNSPAKILCTEFGLIGMLGEFCFSLVARLPANTELLTGGDDGSDFPGVQVKSCKEGKGFGLVEFMDKQFEGFYVLVHVNLEQKYGIIRGWIHSNEFEEKHEVRDFGFGPRKFLSPEKLHPYFPKKPVIIKPVATESHIQ